MALDLTPEQKAAGKANFEQAAGDLARAGKMNSLVVGGTDPKNPDRRDVLKASLAAGAVVPVSAAVYYGYQSWQGGSPVRTALIGTGDEGGVLVGDHNPEYNRIVAVCDVRPSNLDRIFEGEKAGPRKGLNGVYGKEAAKTIAKYDDVDKLLADAKKLGLEAVVIATPLHTHDVIAKKCFDAGLHVLCEKLMANTIAKCKGMTRYAKEKGLLLSIGHQRHYSTLYAHALEVIQSGVLGDIKHIRAQWPRNNSWPFTASPAEREKFATGNDVDGRPFDLPALRDGWYKPVLQQDAEPFVKEPQKLRDAGYESVRELVRWRVYEKTGGGLMAELGSHQLDASSIILGHVHPLSVTGVGGRYFYGDAEKARAGQKTGPNPRESLDSVFVTYEFPGPTHPKHPNAKAGKGETNPDDIVVVTYTSLNTNGFEDYGEWIMGSRGFMIISKEAEVYLYKENEPGKAGSGGRDTKVTVTGAGGGKPAMEATSTWGGGGGAAISKGPAGPAWDTPVRGYRTEMEHFAFCVREWQKRGGKVDYAKNDKGEFVHKDIIPRCHGEVAMADAILALTANMVMHKDYAAKKLVFEDAWFDVDSNEVPETKHARKA